jgi:hypothetical protein
MDFGLHAQERVQEIWTLAYMHKNGFNHPGVTTLFEMHNPEDIPQERKRYIAKSAVRGEVIVFTLDNYPLSTIRKDLFLWLPIDELFTSTFDYMMGMAIWKDYTCIRIFGFEMEMNKEWFYQRPGAYLMMGIAAGRGIEIFIPERSNLMKPQLYGYDGIPKIDPEAIEKLEIIRQGYERQ